MPKPMTEDQAIAALRRVAARWPKSLMLVYYCDGGGSLAIKRVSADRDVDLTELEDLGSVVGFNANALV
jgi:hypothetical protein